MTMQPWTSNPWTSSDVQVTQREGPQGPSLFFPTNPDSSFVAETKANPQGRRDFFDVIINRRIDYLLALFCQKILIAPLLRKLLTTKTNTKMENVKVIDQKLIAEIADKYSDPSKLTLSIAFEATMETHNAFDIMNRVNLLHQIRFQIEDLVNAELKRFC